MLPNSCNLFRFDWILVYFGFLWNCVLALYDFVVYDMVLDTQDIPDCILSAEGDKPETSWLCTK